ncbi:MAG: glycosyltransferase [Chloroflexi bacterium]|nr:glycosyltransferase [Chloroflexota bacterium]
MQPTKSTLRVGYLLRSYPRLSQTFILNEILALEQLGVQVHVFAVTHPHEAIVQAQVADVQAPIDYLEVAQQRRWWAILWEHLWVLLWSPYGYAKALAYVVRHPEIDQGYNASSRYLCFRQAVYLAHLLGRERQCGNGIDHLHAHFAHDPTLIAQLTHLLTGLSYTFTAHARDIYQIPQSALAERIKQGRAVVTCCATNIDYLKATAPVAHHSKLRVIHNGVNLRAFQPMSGTDQPAPMPLILSASRLVEKKGFPDLLHACQHLKQAGHQFRCVIYGDGPLRQELNELVNQLGLSDLVTLPGACTQQELRRVLPQATLFALTPFVTEDGDRDGVPTVLVEAMACGVPVISTSVAGITELVTHNENGLLAEPHDVTAIAAALATLLEDEPKRRQLSAVARRTVAEQFDLRAGAQQLADLFYTTAKGALQ